jgi:hypothetical protein
MKNKLFQVPSARKRTRKTTRACSGGCNGNWLKGGTAYGTIIRKRGEYDTAVR